MKGRVIGLIVLAAGVVMLGGCSRIQEPWVPNESYLKEERTRTIEHQQQLRERLLYNQIDRTPLREMNRTS